VSLGFAATVAQTATSSVNAAIALNTADGFYEATFVLPDTKPSSSAWSFQVTVRSTQCIASTLERPQCLGFALSIKSGTHAMLLLFTVFSFGRLRTRLKLRRSR
jgi:hypothetical protein